MKIRKSEFRDLPAILSLYANARRFMAEHGNPTQWGESYHSKEIVQADITLRRGYVCEEGQELLAAFVFCTGEEPSYRKIDGSWLNDTPYGFVHRIASNGGRGAAMFSLSWCLLQCGNLRIDTHADNLPMQSLLKKMGFSRCGIIRLEDGTLRTAFQKCIQ